MAGDDRQHSGSPQGQGMLYRAEVERVLAEAERLERAAHGRVRFWTLMDVALGFPAAVLAALSGAAGLSSPGARVPAALLALVAAGFAAGAGFLRSDVRRAVNRRSRLAWAEVEAGARWLLVNEDQMDGDAGPEALRSLLACRTRAIATHAGNTEGDAQS